MKRAGLDPFQERPGSAPGGHYRGVAAISGFGTISPCGGFLANRGARSRVDRACRPPGGLFVQAVDLGVGHVVGDLPAQRPGDGFAQRHHGGRSEAQDEVRPGEGEPDSDGGHGQQDASRGPEKQPQGDLTCSGVTVPVPGVGTTTAVPPNRL